MDKFKITQTAVDSNNVKSAPDTIRAAGNITIKDAKNWFDRLPELIVSRYNALVAFISENFYTNEEVEQAIANKVVAIGAGDMAKKNYDTDGDGSVNSADNGYFIYTQAANGLTGSGILGRFKATQSGIVSSVSVNGETCSVKCGEDSSVELVEGSWYTFILDGATINFNTGSGLTGTKLALATAEENNVAEGKTFYSKSKTIKTGTLSAGTVKATDVRKGVTFYNGTGLEDGARPAGTATAADVMADKTFDNGTKLENGEIARKGAYTDAVSCADGEGDVYVRIPKGAYLSAGASGYPEVLVNDGMLASAIGLTANKLCAGSEVLGVKSTAVDLSSLGTPTWTHSGGTALASKNVLTGKEYIALQGENASGWGHGVYTFPNKIEVSEYSQVKIHSIVSRAEIYSGGDTTKITISGKTVDSTSKLQKMTHTFDVSGESEFELKISLGWHAGNFGSVTVCSIELS